MREIDLSFTNTSSAERLTLVLLILALHEERLALVLLILALHERD